MGTKRYYTSTWPINGRTFSLCIRLQTDCQCRSRHLAQASQAVKESNAAARQLLNANCIEIDRFEGTRIKLTSGTRIKLFTIYIYIYIFIWTYRYIYIHYAFWPLAWNPHATWRLVRQRTGLPLLRGHHITQSPTVTAVSNHSQSWGKEAEGGCPVGAVSFGCCQMLVMTGNWCWKNMLWHTKMIGNAYVEPLEKLTRKYDLAFCGAPTSVHLDLKDWQGLQRLIHCCAVSKSTNLGGGASVLAPIGWLTNRVVHDPIERPNTISYHVHSMSIPFPRNDNCIQSVHYTPSM